MGCFTSEDARELLHNKYVVVLGDSIQRSVYKDLVLFLQDDKYLTEGQLKRKGEMSFQNDTLVEGGMLNEMHNGPTYREVRQYRTGHHLVRFYFLTRIFSEYMESILADFQSGPQPDAVILNSCIWDLIRYDDYKLEAYKANLDALFCRLSEVLTPECLVIWNTTMPVGFREGEIPDYSKHNLRWDIIEGNFYSATLAHHHHMDVLDMHYHFRFDMRSRCRDATHWDQLAHRKYTQILLAHIAQAWGVQCPERPNTSNRKVQIVRPVAIKKNGLLPLPVSQQKNNGPIYIPGYTDFGGTNCGAFYHEANQFHGNFKNPDVSSPFISDNPILNGLANGFISFDQNPKMPPANRTGPAPGFIQKVAPAKRPAPAPFGNDNSLLGKGPAPGFIHQNQNVAPGNRPGPFAHDHPIMMNGPGPGFMPFDKNPNMAPAHRPVHPFVNPCFAGMNIRPQMPVLPMQFPAFRHDVPMPTGGWNGPPRFVKRRLNKPSEGWMHPYYRPPMFPLRN